MVLYRAQIYRVETPDESQYHTKSKYTCILTSAQSKVLPWEEKAVHVDNSLENLAVQLYETMLTFNKKFSVDVSYQPPCDGTFGSYQGGASNHFTLDCQERFIFMKTIEALQESHKPSTGEHPISDLSSW